MPNKSYGLLDRLFVVALTLLMAYFAYQVYSPGFGWKTVKEALERAAGFIR